MANSVSFDAVRSSGETVLVTVTALGGGKGQISLSVWPKGQVATPPAPSQHNYAIERIRRNADGSVLTAVHRIVLLEVQIRIQLDRAGSAATLFIGKDDKVGERLALSASEMSAIDAFVAKAHFELAAS